MPTISRKWPTETPNGVRPAMCDYCGVMWPSDKLERDSMGYLACPDEGNGRDAAELTRANAEYRPRATPRQFQGGYDQQSNPTVDPATGKCVGWSPIPPPPGAPPGYKP